MCFYVLWTIILFFIGLFLAAGANALTSIAKDLRSLMIAMKAMAHRREEN